MKHLQINTICVAVMVALPAIATAQVKLEFKYKQGEKYTTVVQNKMTSTANVNNRDMKTTVDQTLDITNETVSIDSDGKAKLTQTIDRVRMKMKLPNLAGQEAIEYDSSEPEKAEKSPYAMMTKQVAKLAGQSFKMTRDSRGEFSEIELPESLNKNAINQQARPSQQTQQLKEMVTAGNITFPEEAISKGHSWTNKNSVSIPTGGAIETTITFTYDGTNSKGLHVINAKLEMKFTPGEKPGQFQMNMKGKGGKGVFLFDQNLGRVVESSMENKIDMEMNFAGQTINQSIETVTTSKIESSK